MAHKLKVAYRPIGDLIPFANNARTHSEEQVSQIAASIREFGWTNPVLVDGANGIIAGHGRVLAARKLDLETVPCIELAGLSEAQKRAYVIADNRLAENAGWDDSLLALELGELKALDFDLALTGFSDEEFLGLEAAVAAAGREADPEAAPEPPEQPVAIRGDLWALGRHRVLCGDATSEEDVARLLGGAKPHLMVTDPPYGVEYDPDWRNKARRASKGPFGVSKTGKVENDDEADWRGAWALFPGDVAYVWHAGRHAGIVEESLGVIGFEIRSQIIWAKQHFALSRGDYHWQHEPCWYAVRKGSTAHWSGDRKQTTLWMINNSNAFGGDQDDADTNHGTQKPIECMRRPIVNNSQAGDAIYDPFLGSGTTVIAAEMEGRVAYGLEIEPAYIDVIVRRWQDYTGMAATLDGDGRTFEEVAAERVAAAA